MDKFYIIGTAQALFFVVLILTKRGKVLSDYLLALFIFLLGSELFFTYCQATQLYPRIPQLAVLDIYFWTLLGPCLLLYTQTKTTGREQFEKRNLFYLIPALIATIAFAGYLKIDVVLFNVKECNGFQWFARNVWFFNMPIFIIAALFRIHRHQKAIKNYYSYSHSVDFKWLAFLTYGFSVFLLFLYTSYLIYRITSVPMPETYNFKWLILTSYVFGLGFYGYRQKGVFDDNSELSQQTVSETSNINNKTESFYNGGRSYQKSGLMQEDAEMMAQQLIALMEREKPYLDSELRLASLAEKLNVTPHNLSQVINSFCGKSFFEFVNSFRIDEAQKILSDPNKQMYKMMTIAYDSGFNSKTSFYAFFKKSTSMTPAQYQKNLNSSQMV
ncbi:AraC family transcriptional regulator [bacterium]|nr:AraC family transcriptional regulator [bacterium]